MSEQEEFRQWLREDMKALAKALNGVDDRQRKMQECLTELRASLPKNLDERVRSLEGWRAWIAGISVGVSAAVSFLVSVWKGGRG